MATDRTFSSMLNEYLNFELLQHEGIKRDYLLKNIVPFRGGRASSFRYGALTDASDISQNTFVRGSVPYYKEIWGTMKFLSKDLVEHNAPGKISEQSFLQILPGLVEDFTDDMKQAISVNLLTGTHFASLTVDGTVGGDMTVDRPERFQIDQKVVVDDDDSGAVTGYVISIDINTGVIHLEDTRGGGANVDLSPYTVAQNAKVYIDGAQVSADAFTPLKEQLLSAANGGSATLFGQTKTDYPYLQATNHDGSAFAAATLDADVFNAWTENQILGKGRATDVVMDYTNLGSFMKLLDNQSGPFKHVGTKVDKFGYTEISVIGVNGELKVVGVHEMEQDCMYFMDWSSLRLASNGMFRREADPDGQQYYIVRGPTGYEYVLDIAFFGELICFKPSSMGAIYGISY
jgi:hypothetical protein